MVAALPKFTDTQFNDGSLKQNSNYWLRWLLNHGSTIVSRWRQLHNSPLCIYSRFFLRGCLLTSAGLLFLWSGSVSAWLHAPYGSRSATIHCRKHHHFPCKGSSCNVRASSSRTQIASPSVGRTGCSITRPQLFYITGRSGRTTSRNHARSQYVFPRKTAGPHILCRSVEAVLYTTRPPATLHPRI